MGKEKNMETKSLGIKDDPQCQICGDVGAEFIGERLTRVCQCVLERKIEKAVGETFAKKGFKEYVPKNESQEKALEAFEKNPEGSFYLYGDYRSGKTHLLSAQYSAMIRGRSRKQTVFLTDIEFINSLRKKDPLVRVEDIKMAEDGFHLFFKDFGKITPPAWALEEFFNIFDTIYNRQGKEDRFGISIASNAELSVIADRYDVEGTALGGAIARRIQDICEVIKINN